MAVLEHGGLLRVDLVLTPVKVLEPAQDEAGVDSLVRAAGKEFPDRLCCGVGDALGALSDEDDDVFPLVEVGEMLPGVLRRVHPADRGPVPRGNQLANSIDAVREVVDEEAEVPV